VRTEQRFGSYGVAINEARQLAEQASRVKYLPVKAEALSLLGQVEQPVDARRAEKTLVQAAAAAFESHNQKLVAETWIRLTALTGNILREPEKAASWEMLADAALEALSPSDAEPLQAQLQLARCRVEIAKRAYDNAIRYCQQALALGSKVYGDSRPEVADVLHVLATAYRGKEDYAHAMQNYKEALEVEQKGLGAVHPSIASNLRGIGLTLILQNRGKDAQPYLERALGIMQQSLGQDHIRTSDFYLLVGKNLLALNRVVDAELPLRRCFSIREKATDGETLRAEARYFLGQALARLGSYNEALNLNVVGLELIERAAKRSEARVAYNLHAIGVILIALGRSEEAVPYLERALSIRRNLREEELRANLQRLAETQFALAQALWVPARGARHKGSEQARVRATELAQAAQINYREWGNKPENQLEAVTKWLAAPKNKPPVLAALGFGEGVPASSLPAHGKGSPPASPGQPPLPAADVLAPEPPAAASAPPTAPTSPAEE
jgi:tetratricopeptide (TPR) repeat protein